jgi:hypothetical protein
MRGAAAAARHRHGLNAAARHQHNEQRQDGYEKMKGISWILMQFSFLLRCFVLFVISFNAKSY